MLIWLLSLTALVFVSIISAILIPNGFEPTKAFYAAAHYPTIIGALAIILSFFLSACYIAKNLIVKDSNYPAGILTIISSIIMLCIITGTGYFTFPGFYAYFYTEENGVEVTRTCTVTHKDYSQNRGGEIYSLDFSDKCFGMSVGYDVGKERFDITRVGDNFLLTATASNYGVKIKKIAAL